MFVDLIKAQMLSRLAAGKKKKQEEEPLNAPMALSEKPVASSNDEDDETQEIKSHGYGASDVIMQDEREIRPDALTLMEGKHKGPKELGFEDTPETSYDASDTFVEETEEVTSTKSRGTTASKGALIRSLTALKKSFPVEGNLYTQLLDLIPALPKVDIEELIEYLSGIRRDIELRKPKKEQIQRSIKDFLKITLEDYSTGPKVLGESEEDLPAEALSSAKVIPDMETEISKGDILSLMKYFENELMAFNYDDIMDLEDLLKELEVLKQDHALMVADLIEELQEIITIKAVDKEAASIKLHEFLELAKKEVEKLKAPKKDVTPKAVGKKVKK